MLRGIPPPPGDALAGDTGPEPHSPGDPTAGVWGSSMGTATVAKPGAGLGAAQPTCGCGGVISQIINRKMCVTPGVRLVLGMPCSALLSQAAPATPGLYIPRVPVPSPIPLTPRGDGGPASSCSTPPPARRRQPGFIRHYLFLYTLIHTVPRVVSSSPSSVLSPCRVWSAVGGTHTLPRVPGAKPSWAMPPPHPCSVYLGGGQSPPP